MSADTPGQITQLLNGAQADEPGALEKLIALTYEELQQVSRRMMAREPNHTLQPTALLNEALQRLLTDDVVAHSPNRSYFFAAAAQAMRRCLVEAARRRKARKAGGDLRRLPFDDQLDLFNERSLDLLALDEAMETLATLSPRQHRVVDLRWFGRFSVADIARMLDVSVSTVESDWRLARAYLRSRIRDEDVRDG